MTSKCSAEVRLPFKNKTKGKLKTIYQTDLPAMLMQMKHFMTHQQRLDVCSNTLKSLQFCCL